MSKMEYNETCSLEELGTYFLPGTHEYDWPVGVRILLYAVLLAWLFTGVAIIANVFMEGIEQITAAEKTVKRKDGTEEKVRVWNPSIANLSLMALGSSAPEIVLNIIEVVGAIGGGNFVESTKKGEEGLYMEGSLGPGTIVGSAAFNLLVIIGICTMAIPAQQRRKIDAMSSYVWTAFWAVAAYLWLVIILMGSTPNIVDFWEALLTLIYFPIMLLVAYKLDIEAWPGACIRMMPSKRAVSPRESSATRIVPGDPAATNAPFKPDGKTGRGGVLRMLQRRSSMNLRYKVDTSPFKAGKLPDQLDIEEAMKIVNAMQAEGSDEKLSAQQIKAIGQTLKGKSKSEQRRESSFLSIFSLCGLRKKKHVDDGLSEEDRLLLKMRLLAPSALQDGGANVIGMPARFESLNYSIMESCGTVKIGVVLPKGFWGESTSGTKAAPIKIGIRTRDGSGKNSANAGDDYEPKCEIMTFEPGELRQEISIKIIDDSSYEPDETFEVGLSSPLNLRLAGMNPSASVYDWSEEHRCSVLIIDDDQPGELSWEKLENRISETGNVMRLKILRKNGANGDVTVNVRTYSGTAIEDRDFKPVNEWVTLLSGQTETIIEIPIINDEATEGDEHLLVKLEQPGGGARISEGMDATKVWISDDDERKAYMQMVTETLNDALKDEEEEPKTYAQQFKKAVTFDREAGVVDNVSFVITMPFNVVFACVPPAHWGGGWPCFLVALGFIALVTMFISDTASVLGCLLGLSPAINAITLVALGTSLPDTFASKSAAVSDSNADASIGNVTGSNAVNVMLGLGMPWLVATIYCEFMKDTKFVVRSGDLGLSVVVYVVCALICLAVLQARRVYEGGELGGFNARGKYATGMFFILLWLLYVAICWSNNVANYVPFAKSDE